jgi:hypothetical protein
MNNGYSSVDGSQRFFCLFGKIFAVFGYYKTVHRVRFRYWNVIHFPYNCYGNLVHYTLDPIGFWNMIAVVSLFIISFGIMHYVRTKQPDNIKAINFVNFICTPILNTEHPFSHFSKSKHIPLLIFTMMYPKISHMCFLGTSRQSWLRSVANILIAYPYKPCPCTVHWFGHFHCHSHHHLQNISFCIIFCVTKLSILEGSTITVL